MAIEPNNGPRRSVAEERDIAGSALASMLLDERITNGSSSTPHKQMSHLMEDGGHLPLSDYDSSGAPAEPRLRGKETDALSTVVERVFPIRSVVSVQSVSTPADTPDGQSNGCSPRLSPRKGTPKPAVNLLVRFIRYIWFKWFVLVRFGSTSGADLVGLVSSCWFPMETSSQYGNLRAPIIENIEPVDTQRRT